MTDLESIQKISKYLSRFSEQVELINEIGDFSINIYAENLMIKLLNEIYSLNLHNTNTQHQKNYSAIDLIDAEKSICFQVTATKSIEKIKSTIEKYYNKEIFKEAETLKFFILTGKQKTYSRESIQKVIDVKSKKIKGEFELRFDTQNDVLDKSDLIAQLMKDNDLEKIIKVEKLLKESFDVIEQKNNLSPYYDRIKNLFYDIVMDDENGLTLDQIYVEPTFSIFRSSFSKEDKRFPKDFRDKFVNVDPRYKIHEFLEDLYKKNNPLQLNELYRFILILGYPGQGKSSFCKKFINDYVRSKKIEEKDIYYIQLRNIRQVRDFILNPIGVLYDEVCNDTEMVIDRFQFNKSLLVLDGLDELYMKENLRMDEIDRLCIEFAQLINKHSELEIILTSRFGYINDERLTKEKILILQLQLFDIHLQKEWLNKYLIYHPESRLTEEKLDLIQVDKKYYHLKELVNQPLLLHMIASIKEEINEDINRSKLYHQLFTELIDRRYSKGGQLEIFKNISKEDLRELIREISFAIFQTGNEYITKTDLLKLPATQKFLALLPEQNLRESIKGVMISFYFKEALKKENDEEDKSNYAIEFLHKSLREYMTAEKIFITISDSFLDRRKNNKYILDEFSSCLKILNELFAKQDITNEVASHLKQIIRSNDKTNKELQERLTFFLEDFFNYNFLLSYNSLSESYPINRCLRTFHGFWLILSYQKIEKNYLLNNSIMKSFIQLITHLSVSRYITNLDFSYQIFKNGVLRKISLSACNFNKTEFNDCDLSDITIRHCNLKHILSFNTEFTSCHFIATSFEDAVFDQTVFDGINMYSTKFINCHFKKCSFIDLSLAYYEHREGIIKVEFVNCSFEECEIDKASRLEFLKQDYKVDIDSFNLIIEDELPFNNSESTSDNPIKDERIVNDNYRIIVFEDYGLEGLDELPF